MLSDKEFERLNNELRTARATVQDHLGTAVRAWRNTPPSNAQIPITEAWLTEHEELKDRAEDLERQVVAHLKAM